MDKLENTQSEMAIKIENLCNTIDKLASNLNKLTYAIITALVSFFFYAIQNNLFK
ncbi:MAG: hemolysin XhlA family protein [Intestinibacter bartlettii]|nr:hemolysin XhlA family protein [Intestinibacter bartlettii]